MNVESPSPIDEEFHPANHHSLEFYHVHNPADPEDVALLRRMETLEHVWGLRPHDTPPSVIAEYTRLSTSLTPEPIRERRR